MKYFRCFKVQFNHALTGRKKGENINSTFLNINACDDFRNNSKWEMKMTDVC